MDNQFNIADFVGAFKERSGFGVTGAALDEITRYLNERIPEERVRINIPYYDFNVRGKVSKVHRDVHGVMPMTYLVGDRAEVVALDDTDTFFYGDMKAGRGNYIPFLSDCDVYFVSGYNCSDDGTLVIDLKKGPNWRMYL